MSSSEFCHSTLGEITPELHARLVELAHDPAAKSRPDSLSSAQRGVLIDIASLQVKAKRTLGSPTASSVAGEDSCPAARAAWWVTRRGLQQSTQHRVARLKASWMGDVPVVDLCCGLGSDSVALASRGETRGVDWDPDVLAFTQANLRVAGVTASLRQLDVEQAAPDQLIAATDFLHIDPDRRADGHRHTDPASLVPSWSRVNELVRGCRGAVVKLAPATLLGDDETGAFHRTWISTSGSVREQTAICGDILDHPWLREHAMQPGSRSAIVIRGESSSVFASQCDATATLEGAKNGIGQWLIDPDAAIRAAGLTDAFAVATDSYPVDASSGFLSSDSIDALAPWLPMAMLGRVVEVIGCDDRKLRRFFRARNGYPELIKVRGADVDPGQLQRRMKGCGEIPMGLWIGRQGKRTYAAITEMPRPPLPPT